MPTDLHLMTASEAARRLRAGTLRPEALMDACLARIAEQEPRVRAFTSFGTRGARSDAVN
jgi:Asp-tRNA(Asn)/Glu-tRNA(Gln) amidotransferase A subunit family amidase